MCAWDLSLGYNNNKNLWIWIVTMSTYMPDSVYLTVSDRTIDETDRSDSMTGTMRKTKKRKKNNYCTDQIVT